MFSKKIIPTAALSLLLSSSINLTNAAEPQKSTVLPAEAFYALPVLTDIKLSPDGTHIIALKNVGNDTVIMTLNLATNETFYPMKSDNKEVKFRWIDWGNNDRVIFSAIFDSWIAGTSSHARFTRLLAMDAKKKSEMINLVKVKESMNWVSTDDRRSQFQDRVLGRIPSEPNSIILGIDDEIPFHDTAYKVDVTNAHTSTLQRPRPDINWWILDHNGNARIGESFNDKEQKISYKILDPKTKKWEKAWEYTLFESPAITPLGFGKDASELYLLADHEGRQALYKADLSKEGYPWQLILSDPARDIEGELIYSPKLNDVVGIYYNNGENKSVFFNEEYKKFQAGLNKAIPNASNFITSMSADGRKYILYSTPEGLPTTIYFGDRDTKQLSPLVTLYPQLTEDILAKKEYITYKARDSLEIGGYLSKPQNTKDKPIATIIFPHGGPMAEDGAEFDPFTAFFVNRGYAVFQPNFRGSTGRGFEFEMKAVGNYGLAMQDDLEDAAKFLVEKKIADPARLGIVGGSYGGYAALMGATKTPDLFKCAISLAGISDMKKLRDTFRYFSNNKTAQKQLGEDTEQLKSTSPVRMVDKIKIPILLIHGHDDAVVPVNQSQMMAAELKAQNKTYEYIELEGGTHHFDYLPHRKQTFEAIETFLKKYLPAQ